MKEDTNKSSVKYKPSSALNGMAEREHRRRYQKQRFRCNWNSACKALFLGLMLMFIGGSMATVGYFVDHIYKATDDAANDTISAVVREKSRLNINSVSTYVGPMIMGVGGFIVVAACVMTFEQRDNAAKVIPNRLQTASTSGLHGHSMNRHNKSSPSSRLPPSTAFREGSGRRHATGSGTAAAVAGSQFGFSVYTAPQEPTLDQFSRRELTADFIQFSRNLQQASLKKKFSDPLVSSIINRCPSAPDLATTVDTVLHNAKSPLTKKKQQRVRNSLHPWMGYAAISPRSLPRQALSMDTNEYYSQNTSLPCSKQPSRQGSTSTTGKGSAESLEGSSPAIVRRHRRSPKSSMTLDSRVQSPTTLQDPVTGSRFRDRAPTKRSDTARRHLLMRQAPIELEDDVEKEFRGSNPLFGGRCNYENGSSGKFQSASTPHSRRESYSPRVPSVDGSPRFRQLDCSSAAAVVTTLRCSSPTLRHGSPARYLRSNTVSHEIGFRRDSNTSSDVCPRKGSADYNYHRSRRKSSNTSDSSSRYCSRMNVEEGVLVYGSRMASRRNSKSPTPSLKSFHGNDGAHNQIEQLRRIAHNRANTTSIGGTVPRKNSKENHSKAGSVKSRKRSDNIVDRSLSPDSLSVSSSATEGHSRADYVSIEIDEDVAQDKAQQQ